MVEGTGLENRHTGEPGIESSNLSLSVQLLRARSCALAVLRAAKRCWGRVAEWFKAHAWKVCVR